MTQVLDAVAQSVGALYVVEISAARCPMSTSKDCHLRRLAAASNHPAIRGSFRDHMDVHVISIFLARIDRDLFLGQNSACIFPVWACIYYQLRRSAAALIISPSNRVVSRPHLYDTSYVSNSFHVACKLTRIWLSWLAFEIYARCRGTSCSIEVTLFERPTAR